MQKSSVGNSKIKDDQDTEKGSITVCRRSIECELFVGDVKIMEK